MLISGFVPLHPDMLGFSRDWSRASGDWLLRISLRIHLRSFYEDQHSVQARTAQMP